MEVSRIPIRSQRNSSSVFFEVYSSKSNVTRVIGRRNLNNKKKRDERRDMLASFSVTNIWAARMSHRKATKRKIGRMGIDLENLTQEYALAWQSQSQSQTSFPLVLYLFHLKRRKILVICIVMWHSLAAGLVGSQFQRRRDNNHHGLIWQCFPVNLPCCKQ